MQDHPAPETEITEKWKIACDGGQGALGHPRVWLTIPEETGRIDCPYCDKRYIHASAAPGTSAPGNAA